MNLLLPLQKKYLVFFALRYGGGHVFAGIATLGGLTPYNAQLPASIACFKADTGVLGKSFFLFLYPRFLYGICMEEI